MNERYRLVRQLASGGMAELFLGVARTEGFERAVAIKRVLPQLAQEPDIARMFLAEARLAMLLQHQNIATVYDVGQGPGGLFLVMELVDGWDLGVLLRTAARQGVRFPPHLAAFIVLQTQAGLTHAYRKQHDGRPVMAAHRDVSPSNVLVSREGEVKVTDFGIARLEGGSLTEPGVFRGKEAYSAPEVLQGAPANALSDQFSLGIVFHELLVGRHPFHDVKEPMAVVYAILSREVPPLPPDVPAPLADAVLRMLARGPEQRFPTPEALSETLARWLARSGEPATSHALADFMRRLSLPPTLREQAEAGVDAKSAPAGATHPSNPGPFSLVAEKEVEVALEPGGPALSSSGRLVRNCATCGMPLSAPQAPCDFCAEEAALPSQAFTPEASAPVAAHAPGSSTSTSGRTVAFGATVPGGAGATGHSGAATPVRPAHATSPGGTRPSGHVGATTSARAAAAPGGSALTAHAPAGPPAASASRASASSGQARQDRPAPQPEPAPLPEALPPRSLRETPAHELELEARAPRPESDWVEEQDLPRARKRWVRTAVALGVVAALVGGGLWVLTTRSWVVPMLLAKLGVPMPSPILSIVSNPPGATVLVEGQELGTTPLAVDNLYPDKPISVQLKLRGYRPWKGTFRGGEPVEFKVALER
ncbi:serine/threonine-protein kinase [Pyxidicoccus caerfyrddinensis]|uniref:serine/threonine-protein kinase n=1 Tax=Pyxidicoccus caerfyrddinensis TaxID=2709663 RepID=UPI0013DA5623|nr:serine/threonine-protein kinase [Pyxidicoccus caerfyrddinensis]